jgi:hypothetical protein
MLPTDPTCGRYTSGKLEIMSPRDQALAAWVRDSHPGVSTKPSSLKSTTTWHDERRPPRPAHAPGADRRKGRAPGVTAPLTSCSPSRRADIKS